MNLLLLRRHEPFPAIVTDRKWNVIEANQAAKRLMTLLGAERMMRPLNHMKMAGIAGALDEASLLRSRAGLHNNPGGYVVSHAIGALVLPPVRLIFAGTLRKDAL